MMTNRKIIYILIGLILILASIIIFGLLTSRGSQTMIDGLKSEISKRDSLIMSLEKDIQTFNSIDKIQKEKNANLKNKLDSILKINYGIPNPQSDPIPKHSARNDSIRKWSKRFQ